VIEAFIPEAARASAEATEPSPPAESPSATTASRSIGLPIGRGDVLRAAVAWNLSVEISRTGAPCTLVTHGGLHDASLWPPPGHGPLGSRLVETTHGRGAEQDPVDAEIVLECPPPEGLAAVAGAPDAPKLWLLLSSPDPDELGRVQAQALEIAAAQPDARIGLTIHGVRRVAEARAAFESLAAAVEAETGTPVTSYGLLVDDLHLYRAIVAQRPIGLAHPAAPATRALADVARLLLEDLAEATR
jgi:hypothetical protein